MTAWIATVGDNCIDRYLPPIDRALVGGNAVNVANQRAVDGRQIAVDAIITDRGYPGGHKEALKHDEFAFARSTLTLRRDPGLEPGEPRRVAARTVLGAILRGRASARAPQDDDHCVWVQYKS